MWEGTNVKYNKEMNVFDHVKLMSKSPNQLQRKSDKIYFLVGCFTQ